MLKSYLLLAFKVLARNKFYTCVSLFSISITLMVLVLVTSLVDSFVHPRGPERNSDRILVGAFMSIQQTTADGKKVGSVGSLGYRFIESSVLDMQTPELIAVFSGSIRRGEASTTALGYSAGNRIESIIKRTDANYWKVLQFQFLEGRPLSQQEHEQGAYVAVISATTRELFFPGEAAVGKRITLDRVAYEVIGVVADVSPLQPFATADVWLPIFATASPLFRIEDVGDFTVLLQAREVADLPRIQDEYQQVVRNFQPSSRSIVVPERPLEVNARAESRLDLYIRLVRPPVNGDQDPDAGARLLAILAGAMLAFMALPVLSLMNINTSRILDRASEIGVRKSFGASSGHLVRQFIVENLVVTMLGGLLGLLLAIVALWLLGSSGVLRGESFAFNYRVFGLGLVYILVFGLLSAAGPALRMSRLDPVHALKGAVS